ncbi:hypothetical protein [Microbulbifer sp. S227A]
MTIQPGTRCIVQVDPLECQDQYNRVEELQRALYHARADCGCNCV